MASVDLSKLTASASASNAPQFVSPSDRRIGGVDPLGLRQINFLLMDEVLPGLNNVARHIRPFVVVAWAWRQALKIATAKQSKKVRIDDLQDFVDRVEVIYTWSQLIKDPEADLPGSQVLLPIVDSPRWLFGGAEWQKRRKIRRDSTAFTAAINYGPTLKSLGWIEPHPKLEGLMVTTGVVQPALDAFEAKIADRLDHPAFNAFGSVEVTRQEVLRWAKAWALATPTKAERDIMASMLFGEMAPIRRRGGGALVLAAVDHASSANVERVRRLMAGRPAKFIPSPNLVESSEAWRRVQTRQLFRLSLESLLFWIMLQLSDGPKMTSALVNQFLSEVPKRKGRKSAQEWMAPAFHGEVGPVELIELLEATLDDDTYAGLAIGIADGLSFSLAEPVTQPLLSEKFERLPLARAVQEAAAWGGRPIESFLDHVLESWVLAQHSFWSVGRGLADARAQGKTILRLKVVLEEEGWTLTPGVPLGSPPRATADRLFTALSLAEECGLLDEVQLDRTTQ